MRGNPACVQPCLARARRLDMAGSLDTSLAGATLEGPMTDADAAKRRLIEIVKVRSFSAGGETKLVSGRSTNFYFNMKPSMLHPESAHLIATLTLEALRGARAEYIGGLEIGAVPLATAVAVLSHAQGRPLGAFFVRKQAKEHGAKKLVEGLAPGESLEGRRVA